MLWLIAAASPDNPLSWTTLLEVYGPLGVFAGFGLWLTFRTLDRVGKERDEERAYSKELERSIREQILPLVIASQGTTADAVKVLDQVRTLLMTWLANRANPPESLWERTEPRERGGG